MGFVHLSGDCVAFVNRVANELIASGDFTDADTSLTGDPGRVVHHTELDFYWYFYILSPNATGAPYPSRAQTRSPYNAGNTSAQYGWTGDIQSTTWDRYYMSGIVVSTSTGWDTTTHLPAGTVTAASIPLYNLTYPQNPLLTSWLRTPYLFTWDFWVDQYGIVGVVINTNDTSYPSNSQPLSTFYAFEIIPNTAREFTNQGIPVYMCAAPTPKNVCVRTVDYNNCNQYYNQLVMSNNLGCLSVYPYYVMADNICYDPGRSAYINPFNSKVYFEFPIHTTDMTLKTGSMVQTKRWFAIQGNGFANGDIIQWEDPNTPGLYHKFLVCQLYLTNLSPYTTGWYAIPYENAFDYATATPIGS